MEPTLLAGIFLSPDSLATRGHYEFFDSVPVPIDVCVSVRAEDLSPEIDRDQGPAPLSCTAKLFPDDC